ncbi:MAG: ATP-binding protein [Patescibacteria group bacterium]|jgi:PAS domain S-box-containing protein
MKILIVYHSGTNKTKELAEVIHREMENRGHQVDMERVQPKKDHNFFVWFVLRSFIGDCDIIPPKIKDVSQYDLICIGSPNWTRISLPMARYFKEATGFKYKSIALFSATAAIPSLEWYVISAYLLEYTTVRLINKVGGYFIDSLLLSGNIKKWGVNSEYGKRNIKNFCDRLNTPIKSFKDIYFEKKEVENVRLLINMFFFVLAFLVASEIFNSSFSWLQFLILSGVIVLTDFFMLSLLSKKKKIYIAKYIAGFSLVFALTLMSAFLAPDLGRPVIMGYLLILMTIGFFRDIKAVISTAAAAMLGYGFSYIFIPSLQAVLIPSFDYLFLLAGLIVVVLAASNLQTYNLNLLETLEDIKESELKIKEEEGKTKATLISLTEGLIILNKQEKIALINPEAERILQLKEEEIMGKRIEETIKSCPNMEILFKALGGKVVVSEDKYEMEILNPTKKTYQIAVAPVIASGCSIGSMIIIHDVTREKMIDKMKSEFISIAAHQLRTPLSSVKWMLRMILDGDTGELNDKQKDFLKKGFISNERVIQLVNSMLDISRIEEGRFNYKCQMNDFKEIFKIAVENVQKPVMDKNIKLIVRQPKKVPPICVDKEKILFAVQNLLDNAVKYTPKEGKVELTLQVTAESLKITIQDTGVGIPKAEQSKLFSKFYRGSNVMRIQTEGTGLGLYIAKNVVEGHKGEIKIESEENKGTKVIIILPFNNDMVVAKVG